MIIREWGRSLKGVKVLDLATRRVSIFPGSEGFYVGSRSPDGKYLVAVAQNPLRMMLYNVQTHSWSELRKFDVPWGYWGLDSRQQVSTICPSLTAERPLSADRRRW